MERLTNKVRNFDGTASSKEALVEKGYISVYCEKILTKLADYEDAEENGMLIHLPCKVGNTVYLSNHDRVVRKKEPLVCIVDEFTMSDSECYAVLNANEPFYALHRFKAVNIKDFGKTVFITSKEAKQALAQMKGEN